VFRLIPMIVLSLAVAAAGFVQPALFPWPHHHLVFTIAMLFVLALLWIIVLLSGLVVHGKRGLWLLIGAPLALFWPAMLGNLYLMCHLTMDCM
jgi:hypothetical protein